MTTEGTAQTYTPTGQPATVTDQRGTTRYQYDPRDRLREVVHPDGTTLQYTYDGVGNLLSLTTPTGTTRYTYDARHRLQTVTDPQGGVTTYTYEAGGQRVQVSRPNGTRTHSTYDARQRLTQLVHQHADGHTLASSTYTPDAVGNPVQALEHTGRTVTYTYDALGRLVEEAISDPETGTHTRAYTYDAVGNRLTQTIDGVTRVFTYDANDRLVQAGDAVYTYDANGNTLQAHAPTGDTVYTYDAAGHLLAAQTPHTLVHYTYDAAGHRVGASQNGRETRFLVDTNRLHAQVLEEHDDRGTLVARYVYGPELLSQERGGVTTYAHADGLGSIRLLSDAAGTVTDTYTYEAFGTPLQTTGTTDQRYRFTGEAYESGLELYYLRARYYQPSTGRFVTMDPWLGNRARPLSLHKYLYASANPVTFRDPSGYLDMGTTQIATLNIAQATLRQAAGYQFARYALRAAAAAFLVSLTMCVQTPPIFGGVPLGTPCDEEERRFPIFRSGNNVEFTTAHIRRVLDARPRLSILNKVPSHDHKWYTDKTECNRTPDFAGEASCDEYPFSSTEQGGPLYYEADLTLELVPRAEADSQGRSLGKFYHQCDVKNKGDVGHEGSLFGVITSQHKQTSWRCNKPGKPNHF